VSNKKCLKR